MKTERKSILTPYGEITTTENKKVSDKKKYHTGNKVIDSSKEHDKGSVAEFLGDNDKEECTLKMSKN